MPGLDARRPRRLVAELRRTGDARSPWQTDARRVVDLLAVGLRRCGGRRGGGRRRCRVPARQRRAAATGLSAPEFIMYSTARLDFDVGELRHAAARGHAGVALERRLRSTASKPRFARSRPRGAIADLRRAAFAGLRGICRTSPATTCSPLRSLPGVAATARRRAPSSSRRPCSPCRRPRARPRRSRDPDCRPSAASRGCP